MSTEVQSKKFATKEDLIQIKASLLAAQPDVSKFPKFPSHLKFTSTDEKFLSEALMPYEKIKDDFWKRLMSIDNGFDPFS